MVEPRIVRHESDDHRWEMAFLPPPPLLRRYVHRICGYDERSAVSLSRRELPSTNIALLLELGPPVWIEDRAQPDGAFYRHTGGFIAGLDDRPTVTQSAGSQRGVQVDLTPLGAHRLLQVKMATLTCRTVTFDDVAGADGRALIERLANARDWPARFTLLLDWMTPRLLAERPVQREVEHAWAKLVATGGQVAIEDLASDLGWSRKHLSARFHETIGMAPKPVARLLRFERALDLFRCGGVPAAEVALACGYHDQAHLLRDFRGFAGATPRELLKLALPDEGGIENATR
ncbi:AraC family transcriptional regulator [Roseiterribacter gracilis]|uniref:AraC family transcriptional regulator n=1 Tax=Roseiterribacter gracilis TaxID=2812848 RepID=A0A8S8XFP8_9PROT|nr:AraC family transcriptional regulator [Rhodospirillales bacterium TMPK1]